MPANKTASSPEPPRPIRCAIYTRKSTEEGLEQEFNSLDAQRECAEAYIVSQRHEGWTAVEQHYDDGGFTGANIERPALKHLLADVEAKRVDCLVVYKVDRLSRSLLDFARIMEVLDKRGVSFVSVTQQLNTNSPMGRLTLNVLLSFAQFEREIISERTRDKKSAARRKGKWMGGYPVLGYDPEPGKQRLLVHEAEAQQVQEIFRIYLRHGALTPAMEEIARCGFGMKSWTTAKGKIRVGRPFDRPTLVRLLTNVIYLGEVNHKGTIYPGEHAAIVDRQTWKKVNELLESHRRGTYVSQGHGQESILIGLLACAVCGSRMVHGYARNHGRRYRYYGCLTARKRGSRACPGQTIGAERIEAAVVESLYSAGGEPGRQCLLEALPVNRAGWHCLTAGEQERLLQVLVEVVSWDHRTRQCRIRLHAVTGSLLAGAEITALICKNPLGRQAGSDSTQVSTRPPRVTRFMALAIRFEGMLRKGSVKDYADLARLGGVTRSRITQIMNLRNLAPAIQERLLFLPNGPSPVQERNLRLIMDEADWRRQLQMFEKLQRQAPPVKPGVDS